jgi:hypothetical protein
MNIENELIRRILSGEFKHSLDKPKTREELWDIINRLVKIIEEDNILLKQFIDIPEDLN